MDEPDKAERNSTWAVYRQDDHGNQFVVKTGLTQQQAGELAREFQSRGHKQNP